MFVERKAFRVVERLHTCHQTIHPVPLREVAANP